MQSITVIIVDKLLTNSVLVTQTALRQTSIIVAYDYGCLELIRTNLYLAMIAHLGVLT